MHPPPGPPPAPAPPPADFDAAPDAPLICNLCMSFALRLRPLSSGFSEGMVLGVVT